MHAKNKNTSKTKIHCPYIFSWKAKVGISISALLTLEKDTLRKVIKPFDSSWNSLSNCVF
jgi:hypothetical protein